MHMLRSEHSLSRGGRKGEPCPEALERWRGAALCGAGTTFPGGGAHSGVSHTLRDTPRDALRSRWLSWRCCGFFPRTLGQGRSDRPARPCSGWPERVEPPDWPRRTCNASSRGGRGGLRVNGRDRRGSQWPSGGRGPARAAIFTSGNADGPGRAGATLRSLTSRKRLCGRSFIWGFFFLSGKPSLPSA
ncbi:Hypothetical predicted protein [Marmota monax]|uniref:Uncharacterized protein n=1 Tax=Marmota monax TaxID=9995 RepID=A0A5E4CGS9_MARMO|nr:Hypothetical predicted protein [Marmota monax]